MKISFHLSKWTYWKYNSVVLPVPVGECHHDVEWCQEQHEVKERVGVGDAILLIVHSSVGTTTLLKAVRLRPILDQSRLVTGQSQLVHLGVGRIANTDGQTEEKREHRTWCNQTTTQRDRQTVISGTNYPSACRLVIKLLTTLVGFFKSWQQHR